LQLTPYTSEFKTNLKIAYPVMLGQLGHVLVRLADNVMVGRLGAVPLAAVSLANSLIFITLSIGIGFTFAITPLIAESDSKKDIENGRIVFQHGFLMSVILGVLMFLLLILAKPILYHMDQPEEVIKLAMPYFKIVAFSMIPLMVFQALKQFADGLTATKYAMQAAIIANIINVIINYFLIYGIWIFPRLELIGAGIGTLISRIIMGLFMYYILSKNKKFKSYFVRLKFNQFKKSMFKKIFHIGYPTAMQMFFEVAIFAAGVILAGTLGAIPQAANQIALNLASMTFMIAVGLGVTATIRVGNQKGLGNFKELRRIAFSIFILIVCIEFCFALGFFTFRNYLPLIYINNMKVVAIASSLLVIAGVFQLSDGIQVVVLGALRGLQDVKRPMYITFIAYWVIGFPICYYLGTKTSLGSQGIWIGLLAGLTTSAILLFIRFNKLSNKLIIEKNETT